LHLSALKKLEKDSGEIEIEGRKVKISEWGFLKLGIQLEFD